MGSPELHRVNWQPETPSIFCKYWPSSYRYVCSLCWLVTLAGFHFLGSLTQSSSFTAPPQSWVTELGWLWYVSWVGGWGLRYSNCSLGCSCQKCAHVPLCALFNCVSYYHVMCTKCYLHVVCQWYLYALGHVCLLTLFTIVNGVKKYYFLS